MRYVNKSCFINDVIYKYYLNQDGLTIKNEKTKAERIINSLKDQLIFYKQEGFPDNKLQLRIFKAFFNINNIDYIYKSEYCDIIESVDNKKWYLACLHRWIKRKNNIKLKILLKAVKML